MYPREFGVFVQAFRHRNGVANQRRPNTFIDQSHAHPQIRADFERLAAAVVQTSQNYDVLPHDQQQPADRHDADERGQQDGAGGELRVAAELACQHH